MHKNKVNLAYSPTKGWHEVKDECPRKACNKGGTNKHFVGTPRQNSETFFYDLKR